VYLDAVFDNSTIPDPGKFSQIFSGFFAEELDAVEKLGLCVADQNAIQGIQGSLSAMDRALEDTTSNVQDNDSTRVLAAAETIKGLRCNNLLPTIAAFLASAASGVDLDFLTFPPGPKACELVVSNGVATYPPT
jgi:hypothetical protein